jgi:membrane protein
MSVDRDCAPPLWVSAAIVSLVAYAMAMELRQSKSKRKVKITRGRFGGRSAADEPLDVQQARAREVGRGRRAASPLQIPLAGWKDIFWRTLQQIGEDRLLAVAAGVVFYSLLALFPAVTAFVSFYGLFASPSTISTHLFMLTSVMPQGGVEIVQEQIGRLLAKGDNQLGFGLLFGLALALWSANAGVKAVIDALNVVYDEVEKRSFVKLNLVSLAFTLSGMAAMLLAIAAVVVFPLVLAHFGLGALSERLIAILRWPALMLGLLVALAVLYRYGPSRREARWRWLSVGAFVAAFAWLAGSGLFSWYLAKFAHYDATYGSLGTAIGLMMWMWLTFIVVLVGAELNSEIEHQTAHDTTVGRPKPLGTRGAVMADRVGAAQI